MVATSMLTNLNGVPGRFEIPDYNPGSSFSKTLFTSLESREVVEESTKDSFSGTNKITTYTRVTTQLNNKVTRFVFDSLTQFEGLIIAFTPSYTKYFGVIFFGSTGSNSLVTHDKYIYGLLNANMHHHTRATDLKDFTDYLNKCSPIIYGHISTPFLREKFFNGELK